MALSAVSEVTVWFDKTMALSAVSDVTAWIDELLLEVEKANRSAPWDLDLLGEVYLLQQELKRVKFILEKCWRQDEDMRLIHSFTRIEELAHEAQDAINETLALKTLPKSKAAGVSNRPKKEAPKTIREVTSEIIKKERERKWESNSYWESDNVVGFDDDIKDLVSVLVDDKINQNPVVSIWGNGGLGKTELAKKVYNHSKVRNRFDGFAWAYVPKKWKRRNVWERILVGLETFDDMDRSNSDEQVAAKLFKFLKENVCLVILDNIPNKEAWDSIKAALPRNLETSSKVLITCRNREVLAGSNEDEKVLIHFHELKPLKEQHSLELFKNIAFRGKQFEVTREAEEFVRLCEGVPLAIAVLGGNFATKLSDTDLKFSLGSGREGWLEQLLARNYDSLPSYLKPCLLYLSVFPDGCEISAAKLIQLWFAENIIPYPMLLKSENAGDIIWMEDVAENCLMELIERCMIQVGERGADLKIRTCYMNDMIRDMCLSKADKEKFVHITGASKETWSKRVAIHEYIDIRGFKHKPRNDFSSLFFFNVKFSDELLFRSLHQPDEIYYSTKDKPWLSTRFLLRRVIRKFQRLWRYLINNFKMLRVLEFGDTEIYVGGELSRGIGKLTQLRYLSLHTASYVSKLPPTLGNLTNLKTLNLEIDSKFVVYVPDVIWRLKRLKHLYLPKRCDDKTKLKLNPLRYLQTLVNFNTKNSYVQDLFSMICLRELRISGQFMILEDVEKKLDLDLIVNLRSLSIWSPNPIDPNHLVFLLSKCVNIGELTLNAAMRELPAAGHQFFSNITYLYLIESKLDRDPMQTLEKLPKLKVLGLQNAFTGKKISSSSQGFPELDSLKLIQISQLEEWRVDENAMPKLRHLEIVDCRSLKMLPHGLRHIKTLQELKMEKMPEAFKDRYLVEDFRKFRHIPTVIFQNCH